eukprot:7855338-Pyramimonas_sp.AAC.1
MRLGAADPIRSRLRADVGRSDALPSDPIWFPDVTLNDLPRPQTLCDCCKAYGTHHRDRLFVLSRVLAVLGP